MSVLGSSWFSNRRGRLNSQHMEILVRRQTWTSVQRHNWLNMKQSEAFRNHGRIGVSGRVDKYTRAGLLKGWWDAKNPSILDACRKKGVKNRVVNRPCRELRVYNAIPSIVRHTANSTKQQAQPSLWILSAHPKVPSFSLSSDIYLSEAMSLRNMLATIGGNFYFSHVVLDLFWLSPPLSESFEIPLPTPST